MRGSGSLHGLLAQGLPSGYFILTNGLLSIVYASPEIQEQDPGRVPIAQDTSDGKKRHPRISQDHNRYENLISDRLLIRDFTPLFFELFCLVDSPIIFLALT